MNSFVQVMLMSLDFFFQITRNYGVAIILLTLAIKAAFWNMTAKQYESMAAMRKMQPKMKAIQEKHKKDPQKMNQELMVLYKEHGVNPFSGCLPMLVQLPILIMLFTMLNSNEFLAKTEGKAFLWLKDISYVETMDFSSEKDTKHLNPAHQKYLAEQGLSGFNTILLFGGLAFPLLAILVALSTHYSQKTMDMEPEQQKMMAFMPIMMLFICYTLNAGVLLYWITSNLATVFQQVYMKKHKMVKEAVGTVEVIKPKKKK